MPFLRQSLLTSSNFLCGLVSIAVALTATASTFAQEESVKPGINDSFRDPNVAQYVERFESEGREVYDQREKIVETLALKPGSTVADIGAGTGLFTRLLADKVGAEGRVYAVDIARSFVNRIVTEARQAGSKNIIGVICDDRSCQLPPNSIDLAYICDTYHHFEFPQDTLKSIHQALREKGRLAVVDFQRIEGTSTDWIMGHVRAGKETFQAEIEAAGFQLVSEPQGLLKDNYLLIFEKASSENSDNQPKTQK